MTRQELFDALSNIVSQTFEISADRITPESRLYEDLDIDSIDAVDLIVKLKPLVGKRLQPDAFKAVRTVDDVINALLAMMDEPAAP